MVRSPFKFLDYYHKEDKDIFFGREYETLELYDRIYETNLVLLYGASGTGKTSIINCGLSNQFEPTDWYPIFIRRQNDLLKSLEAELDKHAIKKCAAEASIEDKVKSLYLDYFKPIYLIFDQFEEVFILGDKVEQRAFFEKLDTLLHANLQCKIIISMREEYLAYMSEFEALIPNIFDNRLRIEKMSSRNLHEVIEGTAEAFDIDIPDTVQLTELIIERLRDKNHEVDLANLQVYLDRLYRLDVERRGDSNRKIRFDEELIQKIGTLEDVMSLFLDEQLDVLEKELAERGYTQKNIPIDILFTLVTDNGTKQSMELANIKKQLLTSKKISNECVDYCIQRFKDMRIIRDLSN